MLLLQAHYYDYMSRVYPKNWMIICIPNHTLHDQALNNSIYYSYGLLQLTFRGGREVLQYVAFSLVIKVNLMESATVCITYLLLFSSVLIFVGYVVYYRLK